MPRSGAKQPLNTFATKKMALGVAQTLAWREALARGGALRKLVSLLAGKIRNPQAAHL
jgi:hypothetical protein